MPYQAKRKDSREINRFSSTHPVNCRVHDTEQIPGCSHWDNLVPGEYNGELTYTDLFQSSSFPSGAASKKKHHPPCLRPRPEQPANEGRKQIKPLPYSTDENIVINMGQLNKLVKEAAHLHVPHTCQHLNIKVEMLRRNGLCITGRLLCCSCKTPGKEIDLFSKLDNVTGTVRKLYSSS